MKRVMDRFADAAVHPLLQPSKALRQVSAKSGMGVYASTDTLYRGALIARDSLEVAEHLLYIKPRLVERIIYSLACLQGEVINDKNEEEPGKIIHMYRTNKIDGEPLTGIEKEIFEDLSERWGGTGKTLAYYGSIDATPHFIRLVGQYTHRYGPKILDKPVRLRSGHRLSLRIIVENSLDWLVSKLEQSQSGLLEYQRRNPIGLENQVWKDSKEFYIHENGLLANHDKPIASIEVQGLTYDALLASYLILKGNHARYDSLAAELQKNVIELLWLPERKYFALGSDYTKHNILRIIRTSTANPAALLDTMLFNDMPDAEKELFISAIIRKIMSPLFLTDAGIRSRSLSEAHLVDYWDYHGSFVSWPKETYDIAKGLRRQGFVELAKQLENRLLNLMLRTRNYPEFVFVDEWGRVLTSAPDGSDHDKITIIDSANNPEKVKAWTVSSLLAIVTRGLTNKTQATSTQRKENWRIQLEKDLIGYIPRVNRHLMPWMLSAKYPNYPYKAIKT